MSPAVASRSDFEDEPKGAQQASSCRQRELHAGGYLCSNRTRLLVLSSVAVLLNCMAAQAVQGARGEPSNGGAPAGYHTDGVYFRVERGAISPSYDEDYYQGEPVFFGRDHRRLAKPAHRRERLYSKSRHGARPSRGRGLASGDIANITVQGRTFFVPSLYFITIQIGSTKQEFRVQIDTGSDLFWVPCNCLSCATKSDYYQTLEPPFAPATSTTATNISCSSNECVNIQQSFGPSGPTCNELLPSDTLCEYNITYGDGSFTAGDVYSDTLYLPANGDTATISGAVVFGCGEDQGGNLVDGTNPVEGLVGLSRSGLSVITQLSTLGAFANSFSLCLEGQYKGGHMVAGRTELSSGALYVPQITDNVLGFFYFIGVSGIAVNGTTLSLSSTDISGGSSSSTGGVILDSGTSVTELPGAVYDAILAQVSAATGLNFQEANFEGLITNCTQAPGGTQLQDLGAQFPPIDLLIGSTTWSIPGWNYMQGTPGGNVYSNIPANISCFAATYGYSFILGDTWLRNFDLLFDNVNNRIGFNSFNCTTLTPLSLSSTTAPAPPSSSPPPPSGSSTPSPPPPTSTPSTPSGGSPPASPSPVSPAPAPAPGGAHKASSASALFTILSILAAVLFAQ